MRLNPNWLAIQVTGLWIIAAFSLGGATDTAQILVAAIMVVFSLISIFVR